MSAPSCAIITRKLPTGAVEATMGDLTVVIRETDGFVNATLLCQGGGKLFADWRRIKKTSEFLECLSTTMEIPIVALVSLSINEAIGERHTWVHPRVAVNLAQWISPAYDVLVSGVVERYHRGDLTLAAETVANYDAVHGTTSTVKIDTVLGKRKADLSDGLDIERLEADIVATRRRKFELQIETNRMVREALREAGVLDAETDQFLSSSLKTGLLLLGDGVGNTDAVEGAVMWPVVNRAQKLGHRLKPGQDAALGKRVRRGYEEHYGKSPQKRTIFHRDSGREVFVYSEAECRELVDDIIRTFCV